MSDFSLYPYYHPTTIVIVDDNQSFLDSLDLDIYRNSAFVTFTQPRDALEYLHQPPKLAPLVDRCFSLDYNNANGPVIHLDLSVLEQEMTQVERFRRNAVLIVDYAMPLMNGVELCQQLRDPFIMKAMLTGVADEKIAVQAFNAGLINRFVPKHNLTAVEDISRFVNELQDAYFQQHSSRLQTNLAIDPPAFLTDPAVANYVRRLMDREKLIEYYLVNDPDGLLLLDSAGTMLRLIVLDEAGMQAQVKFATQCNAPANIITQLQSRARLGYFWDSPQDYFGDESYQWQDHMLKLTEITSEQTWYLAIAEDPPMEVDFDPKVSSFDAFLAGSGA